jgi:hypothetical protein
MPSPFPGMDPYLEAHWGDVHQRLVTYAAHQLQERLPPGLKARMQERVFVQSALGPERPIFPDVRVFERRRPAPAVPRDRAGEGGVAVAERVTVAEPLIIRLPDETMTEGFIEILDVKSGNRVITVIEVLSPANKAAGEGQEKYRQKQQELKEAGVSLVEIDLLRTGARAVPHLDERLPASHRTPYQVLVRRGWRPWDLEVYRVPLREPLPAVWVPLREGEPDVPLELQPLVEEAYRRGAYDDTDYTAEPAPPLAPEDAAWADALLKEKGLRPDEGGGGS